MPNMGNVESSPGPALSGIADALFSTTRQRVLAYIFGQPDRSFYASELIALTGSGSGAVQRELARLTQSGLTTVRRIGNQKHYQANPESPVFQELCDIVDKTVALVGPIRKALAPLENDILAAFIYGSVAKRMDTASSDIDLMLISDILSYGETFSALEETTGRLNRAVNPTVYSRAEFKRRLLENNAFIKRVLSQPKLWITGNDEVLATG